MFESVWWHSPGWLLILLLLTVFMAFVTGVIKWIFPSIDREKERLNSMEAAKKIASCCWRVKASPYPDVVYVEMRADDDTMEEFVLLFSYQHPDSEALACVGKLAILWFNFQEIPIEKVEKQDITAYLRIRN